MAPCASSIARRSAPELSPPSSEAAPVPAPAPAPAPVLRAPTQRRAPALGARRAGASRRGIGARKLTGAVDFSSPSPRQASPRLAGGKAPAAPKPGSPLDTSGGLYSGGSLWQQAPPPKRAPPPPDYVDRYKVTYLLKDLPRGMSRAVFDVPPGAEKLLAKYPINYRGSGFDMVPAGTGRVATEFYSPEPDATAAAIAARITVRLKDPGSAGGEACVVA